MKNIIIGALSFVVIILLILILMTNFNRDSREAELTRAVEYAMDYTLDSVKDRNEYSPSSDEEMYALFTQALFSQINSASHITIKILDIDYQKGLLNVEVISTYSHVFGREGNIAVTKFGLIDAVKTEYSYEMYTVSFYTDDGIYKTYTVKEGEKLPIPLTPSVTGKTFNSWVDVDTGATVNANTIVNKDMTIKAKFS